METGVVGPERVARPPDNVNTLIQWVLRKHK